MKQPSLANHAALSTVGVLVQGLARFGYTVLVGRFVGASELGHVSNWLAYSLIFSLLWPAGAGIAASHLLATPSGAPTLRLLIRTFCLSGAVLFMVQVAIVLIGYRNGFATALAAGVLTVTYSGYIFCRGVLIGLGRVREAAIWDCLSAFVTIILLVPALKQSNVAVLLLPIAIGYGTFTAYAMAATRSTPQDLPSGARRLMYRTTAFNSLTLLASNGLVQLAMLFVYGRGSGDIPGYFAAVISLATPASMLAQAITQVLIPRLSSHAADNPSAAEALFRRALTALSASLAVIFGIGLLVSSPVLKVFYGAKYSVAVLELRVLLVAVFVFSIGLIANAFLLSTGRVARATSCSLAGFVIGCAVIGISAEWLSAQAAASLGVLVGYLVGTGALLAGALRGKHYAVSRSTPAVSMKEK